MILYPPAGVRHGQAAAGMGGDGGQPVRHGGVVTGHAGRPEQAYRRGQAYLRAAGRHLHHHRQVLEALHRTGGGLLLCY